MCASHKDSFSGVHQTLPDAPRTLMLVKSDTETPLMNATLDFPRLTASEEAELILQDVFDEGEEDIQLSVLEALCAEEGIAFDWEANGSEIEEIIIEREDDIYMMADSYRNTF